VTLADAIVTKIPGRGFYRITLHSLAFGSAPLIMGR